MHETVKVVQLASQALMKASVARVLLVLSLLYNPSILKLLLLLIFYLLLTICLIYFKKSYILFNLFHYTRKIKNNL